MSRTHVVLCAPKRTPIGTFGGKLKRMPASDLAGLAIHATLEQAKLQESDVQAAFMGHVIQAGCKMNSARQAVISAGLPVSVPAMTVNRVCGSGAQAIVSAAQEIWLGHLNCAVAGGMENMDMAPYLLSAGRWGYRMGTAEIFDSMLRDGLNDGSCIRLRPERPNHVWSYDVVQDRAHDGRVYRTLNIIDEFTKE